MSELLALRLEEADGLADHVLKIGVTSAQSDRSGRWVDGAAARIDGMEPSGELDKTKTTRESLLGFHSAGVDSRSDSERVHLACLSDSELDALDMGEHPDSASRLRSIEEAVAAGHFELWLHAVSGKVLRGTLANGDDLRRSYFLIPPSLHGRLEALPVDLLSGRPTGCDAIFKPHVATIPSGRTSLVASGRCELPFEQGGIDGKAKDDRGSDSARPSLR